MMYLFQGKAVYDIIDYDYAQYFFKIDESGIIRIRARLLSDNAETETFVVSLRKMNTVKPVLSGHLKINKTKV